jgi:hypothetical protein
MQFEKGNLVKNPSFEQGRLIQVDSNTVSYNITGWKAMGENLTWVMHQADTGRPVHDVRSGSYSIEIFRSREDASINRGEGIVSDFIRVIPGNYELSFWIRLQDVHPGNAGMGSRMNDAVNIRLLFYDKNRLLISGNRYDPLKKAVVDQSFKSLPFANYWEIDSLGWTRVGGLTTYDFLGEGDIPDEAKFVKLYLGLNGTGKMWVDDIDFRYSRRNFTTLEKVLPMFDTTCARKDMLIPVPKQVNVATPVTYHVRGTDSIPMPAILIPPGAKKQTRMAARILKSRLDKQFELRFGKDSLPDTRIITDPASCKPGEGGLVFCIGKQPRDEVFEKLRSFHFREAVAADPEPGEWTSGRQGYVIEADSALPGLVYLSGASPYGDYYAAATAVQLLDDSLFLYHSTCILDYPDIPERAFLVSPVAAASNPIDYTPFLSDMAGLKMNWAYLDSYRSRTLWQQVGTAYLEGLKVIGRESREEGMLNLAQMFNPYAFLPANTVFDHFEEDMWDRWTHSGYSDRAKLLKYYEAGIRSGVKTIVFCSHDYLPGSAEGNHVLFAEEDRKKYINLQEAHLDLLEFLSARIHARHPSVRIEFSAPWCSNEDIDLSRGQAEHYYQDLSSKLPSGLDILWSGPARNSHTINSLDYQRFQGMADRKPVLMDNSMNTVREILDDTAAIGVISMKIRTLNLFGPYDVRFPESFILPESTGKMLINSAVSTGIMKIRIATAADFMWNMDSYDPELSIWKVLVSRYGIPTTRELYEFNDAYFCALTSVIGLKNGIEPQKNLKLIADRLDQMEGSLGRLGQLAGFDDAVLNELKSLKQSLEILYDSELKTVAGQIVASMESM